MLTKPKPQSSEKQALQEGQAAVMRQADACRSLPPAAKANGAETAAVHHAADMEAVKTVLRRLLKPEAVDGWLQKEVPSLGYRKPMDLIQNGEVKQVIEVLVRMEEGIHS